MLESLVGAGPSLLPLGLPTLPLPPRPGDDVGDCSGGEIVSSEDCLFQMYPDLRMETRKVGNQKEQQGVDLFFLRWRQSESKCNSSFLCTYVSIYVSIHRFMYRRSGERIEQS